MQTDNIYEIVKSVLQFSKIFFKSYELYLILNLQIIYSYLFYAIFIHKFQFFRCSFYLYTLARYDKLNKFFKASI